MRRLLAVLGALALLGTGTLAIAAPAQATARHVGVVVRYGNGRISAGCATVGGSGLQVLEQHHSVRMGTAQYGGFVIQIDGVGTTHPDDTHYWSYWHSGGQGTWHYASSGAASYRPKAGTVEGWSYVNGQSSAPRPPARTYAALCGHLDPHAAPRSTAASSSASTAASTAPSTAASRPAASRSAAAPLPRPVPRTSAPVVRTRVSAAAPARHATRAAKPHPSRSTAPRSPARSTAAARPAATPTRPAAQSRSRSSSAPTIAAGPAADTSGTNAWPTIAALAVVAALGLTAWFVMRRRAG